MRPRVVPLLLSELESRYTPAVVGGLDGSFGTGGLATFNVGGGDVVIDAAGRTLLAGFTPGPGGGDFLIQRLLPDGTPDPAFGTGGRVVLDFAGSDDRGRRVSLDPVGNILVAGYADPGTGKQIAVARLSPAGVADSGFGTAG